MRHSGRLIVLLTLGRVVACERERIPPSGGTDDLLAAPRGLDSLANDVRDRRPVAPLRLDRLSAHANLAEAERHGALASVAWATRSTQSLSDELSMAADHVERAALDGQVALTPGTRRVLAELRAMSRDLCAHRGRDLRELDEPLGSLHFEIQAMHRRLERAPKAGAPGSMVHSAR